MCKSVYPTRAPSLALGSSLGSRDCHVYRTFSEARHHRTLITRLDNLETRLLSLSTAGAIPTYMRRFTHRYRRVQPDRESSIHGMRKNSLRYRSSVPTYGVLDVCDHRHA